MPISPDKKALSADDAARVQAIAGRRKAEDTLTEQMADIWRSPITDTVMSAEYRERELADLRQQRMDIRAYWASDIDWLLQLVERLVAIC